MKTSRLNEAARELVSWVHIAIAQLARRGRALEHLVAGLLYKVQGLKAKVRAFCSLDVGKDSPAAVWPGR